ncbi:MAG: DUF3298 and DUF4163 domain-containing protein [Armatimonadetes bacterium]|nr:DUF3298 and DUF4163 domain-containing protein [Armatimonadota bacterium]
MKKCLLTVILLAAVWQTAAAGTTYKTLKAAQPGYYRVEIRYPHFADNTPLARLANRTIREWARRQRRRFIEEARKSFRLGRPIAAFELTARPEVTLYSPSRLISLYFDTMEYTGGAHPTAPYHVMNFGMAAGKPRRLSLADLFRPGSSYRKAVSDAVIARLRTREGADWVQNGEMKALDTFQLDRFVIGRGGLTFLINEYEAGPYAAGRFEIKLPLRELGPDFRRSLIQGR